jgi:hypothetical protein
MAREGGERIQRWFERRDLIGGVGEEQDGHTRGRSFCPGVDFAVSLLSIGNVVKIVLRWATWYRCRRAFVTGMPKRGKKGTVAEDAEEHKTGKSTK